MRTRIGLLQEQKSHLVMLIDSLTDSKEAINKAIDKTANALEIVKMELASEMVDLEKRMRGEQCHIMLAEELE